MPRFEKHVFVCTNERPAGHLKGSCAACGGKEIKSLLKSLVKQSGLADSIRINSASCLDACEFGTAIVIYPEATWYGRVRPEDAEELYRSHLLEGKVVERLRISESDLQALATKTMTERFGVVHPEPPKST